MTNLKREATFQIKWRYLVWAIIIAPIAAVVAVTSSGFGHGSYFFSKLFFPYMMLSALSNERVIPAFMLWFSIFLQIPIYGVLLALSPKKYIRICVGISILVLHLIAVYLCFQIPMPNFP